MAKSKKIKVEDQDIADISAHITNQQKKEYKKMNKPYHKSRSEHYKDIAIAVLITAIATFALGIYATTQYIDSRPAPQVTQVVQAEPAKKQ